MSSSLDHLYNSNNISFSRQSFGGFSCGGSVVNAAAATTGNGKKGGVVCLGDKAMAALKSHSDAERRRRERINSHLATFRRLLPFTQKMDKASLLGEVIRQVKELKKNAIEASKGLLMIPTDDADQVKVEACKSSSSSDVVSSFKATLCCGFHPNLLSQVRLALEELPHVKLANVEICTVGGRLKTKFLFNADNYSCSSSGNKAQLQEIVDSVHYAITCVMEKTFASSSSVEYLPPCSNPNKRRRVSSSNSCTSSSL